MPASSGLRVPATAALDHPCALLPDTMTGTPLPPRPATRGSHPVSGSSPLGPPRWITDTPFISSRMFFPRDAGCLKIPYGLAPRFRSTAFLCRRRATKTLLRSAVEIARVTKVNGGHKLGPDLRATNEEIRHDDCGYRRQRA